MLETLFQVDGQLLLAIQNLHQPWLDPIVSIYTQMGNAGILWIVLSLGMLIPKSTRKAGAVALCAMILGLLVTNVTVKPLIQRPRPWLSLPINPMVTERDPYSFPSGHTCAAFAAGVSWARALPWKGTRIAAVVLAGSLPDRRAGRRGYWGAVRLGRVEALSSLCKLLAAPYAQAPAEIAPA